MFKKDPKTGRKIAVGSALAATIGYFVGILTAPKSGKETRADIASTADEVKFDIEAQLKQAEGELARVVKEAQTKSIALGAQAREEFNEALIRAKDAQAKTKTMIKGFKAGSSEDPELNRALKQAKQAKKNLSKFLKN